LKTHLSYKDTSVCPNILYKGLERKNFLFADWTLPVLALNCPAMLNTKMGERDPYVYLMLGASALYRFFNLSLTPKRLE